MSLPLRFAPPTQMDALRAHLAGYWAGDRTFETQLVRQLDALGELALPELGRCLARNTTPSGLRSQILAVVEVFDWPEWDVHLMHMLQPEENLELFDQGCAALGSLCTPRALKWLQRLKELRRDEDRQAILQREIDHYQSGHSPEECLAYLMAGRAQAEVARLGARGLAAQLEAVPQDELIRAFHEGDTLARHLALRLIAALKDESSSPLLFTLFQELRSEPGSPQAQVGLGDVAGRIVARVEDGKIPLEEALPLLEGAFQSGLGGEDLRVAYLRLIPPDDKARLDRILAEPDAERRMKCFETLGAREEDALVPFFLKAMHDPSPEAAQLAIRQFGKLPSGAPAMLKLFRSEHPDQVRMAVRFFEENAVQAAAKPLVGLLPQDVPDDLLLDAVKALGAIRDPSAANALLNLLHDGKPLQLQLALVEALAQLRSPTASLGLLKKAEKLRVPQVLHLALEGTLVAFPDFTRPLPEDQVPALEKLVERCCDPREGDGQWPRVARLVQDLYVFNADLYRRLKERFLEHIMAARHRSGAEKAEAEQVAGVVDLLHKRALSLSLLEEREAALRSAVEALPESGPGRLPALQEILERVRVPELVLSVPFSEELVALVRQGLLREAPDPGELEVFAAIAGGLAHPGLVEPLRDAFAHAAGPDLQAAFQEAAKAMGLAPQDLERRAPIATVLLLEPNPFFRKRLTAALEGRAKALATVGTREEAAAALSGAPVDLVISETHDEEGELGPWLEGQWEQRRMRYVLLSTANHDLGALAGKPWVIGRLYKPYPLDEATRMLG